MSQHKPTPGRCGAQKKQARWADPNIPEFCDAKPAAGHTSGRCRFHGGANKIGVAAHSYQGRGYSQNLPTRMREAIERHLGDPHLINLEREVLLIDQMMGDEAKKLKHGLVEDRVRGLRSLCEGALIDLRNGETDRGTEKVEQLLDMLKAEVEDNVASDRMVKLLEKRRLLADTERKRMEQESNTMTASQAAVWMGNMVGAVADLVEDASLVDQIIRRFQQLTAGSMKLATPKHGQGMLVTGGDVSIDELGEDEP